LQCCLPRVRWNVYWKHLRHSKRVAKFGFIWYQGFFCSLLWGSQFENHPQEDLAKIGYKESFLCITKLSTCCQMRHLFSFFPKIQKNGKNKDGQNCKFIFIFQRYSPKRKKQSNIISLESCLVLATNRNSLSKYGNIWPFLIKIWQLLHFILFFPKKPLYNSHLVFFSHHCVKICPKKKHWLGHFSLKTFSFHRSYFFVNFMKGRFKKIAIFYFILN
jgi:hypothetical protein